MQVIFGRVIRILSHNTNITCKMLAKDLGVHYSTVYNYMRFTTYPSEPVWQGLENKFGVNRSVLLGHTPNDSGEWIWDLLDVPKELLTLDDDQIKHCVTHKNVLSAIQILYRAGINPIVARLTDCPARLLAIAAGKDAITYGELLAGRIGERKILDWVKINFSDQTPVKPLSQEYETQSELKGGVECVGGVVGAQKCSVDLRKSSLGVSRSAEGLQSAVSSEVVLKKVSGGIETADKLDGSQYASQYRRSVVGFDRSDLRESARDREKRLRLMVDPEFDVVKPHKVCEGGLTHWVLGEPTPKACLLTAGRGDRRHHPTWTKLERDPTKMSTPEDLVVDLQCMLSDRADAGTWVQKELSRIKSSSVSVESSVDSNKQGAVTSSVNKEIEGDLEVGNRVSSSVMVKEKIKTDFVCGRLESGMVEGIASSEGKDETTMSEDLLREVLGESIEKSSKDGTGYYKDCGVEDDGVDNDIDDSMEDDLEDEGDTGPKRVSRHAAVLKPISTKSSFEDYIKLKRAAFDEQLKRMEQMPVPMAGMEFNESRVRFEALSCMKGKYVIWLRTKGITYRNIGFIEIVKKNHTFVIQGLWIEEEFRDSKLMERLIRVFMGFDPQAIIKIKVEYNDPALQILQQLGFMTQSATLTLCTPGVSKRLHDAERKTAATVKEDKFVDLEF